MLPANSFFQPGNEFTIRLRHANVVDNQKHDAAFDARGCAIKFADSSAKSPYDLLMNTGENSLFYSVETFLKFVLASTNEKYQTFAREAPSAVKATIGTLRRAPNSYSDLHYYSQTPVQFFAEDGKERYARFRVVPYGDGPGTKVQPEKSGLPDLEDQVKSAILCPKQLAKVSPDETRPANYLKEEFKLRVDTQGVKYRLQMQLYEWSDNDDREVFNPNKEWDYDTHPYFDIGIIELTEALSDRETENLHMWIGRHPRDTIGLIKAWSNKDYNSINIARNDVYPYSQKMRKRV